MDKQQHEFSEVLQNLDKYRNLNLRKKNDLNMRKHKKKTRRIKNDPLDRTKLQHFLITYIHLLQSESHTDQIAEKIAGVNKPGETGIKSK